MPYSIEAMIVKGVVRAILAIVVATVFLSCVKERIEPPSQLFSQQSSNAEINPTWKWYADIMEFKRQDAISFPAAGGIVFVGSSSIRLWDNIQTYFPGYPIIQRGFGGSVIGSIELYMDSIITCYKPRQVVIYSGENDLASGKTAPQMLRMDTILFNKIRAANPASNITFLAIKPSPLLWDKNVIIEDFNRLLKSWLAKKPNATFVDVNTPMLLWNPKRPNPILYKADGLHMTLKGYEIWGNVLRPALVRDSIVSPAPKDTIVTPPKTDTAINNPKPVDTTTTPGLPRDSVVSPPGDTSVILPPKDTTTTPPADTLIIVPPPVTPPPPPPPPAQEKIIFFGSTMVERWPRVDSSFAGYPVIAKGHHDASFRTLMQYVSSDITANVPKQVVICSGEYDIYTNRKIYQVCDDFKALVAKIWAENPGVHITFLHIKPSMPNWDKILTIENVNSNITKWLATEHAARSSSVNTYTINFAWPKKVLKPEYYENAGFNLTYKAGYPAWNKTILPALKK